MTLEIALMIVGFLIVIVGIVSGITSIWLVVKDTSKNSQPIAIKDKI